MDRRANGPGGKRVPFAIACLDYRRICSINVSWCDAIRVVDVDEPAKLAPPMVAPERERFAT